jgi:hypothetical protein
LCGMRVGVMSVCCRSFLCVRVFLCVCVCACRVQGPDFEVKKTVPCIACCFPCCIRCLQRIDIKDPRGDAILGSIKPSSCCDILGSMICYGKNHPMFTTKDVDNADKFVLR